MATAPFDIIAGPAEVWIAPAAEAFPDADAVPAGNWVNLGRTEGGITVTHNESIELLRVDQASGPVKAIRSEESLVIEFSLAELELEDYARILNDVTVTDAGDNRWLPLRLGFDVVQRALLIRGPTPYVAAPSATIPGLQYELPIVVQTGSPTISFTRDDKSVLESEWNVIEDPAAATVGERFGRLRAMDT
jgi:hypothetical protein